jgi:hypothetical protein
MSGRLFLRLLVLSAVCAILFGSSLRWAFVDGMIRGDALGFAALAGLLLTPAAWVYGVISILGSHSDALSLAGRHPPIPQVQWQQKFSFDDDLLPLIIGVAFDPLLWMIVAGFLIRML